MRQKLLPKEMELFFFFLERLSGLFRGRFKMFSVH